jgi:site-specific DNA recombinase
MPTLRKRQTTLRAQLDALDTELHDAETYLKLADTLESFLDRLNDRLDQLNLDEQQRILRLVVREVLIGGDDDTITVRHSIPTPTGPDDPSHLLRGSGHRRALRAAAIPLLEGAILMLKRCFQPPLHVEKDPPLAGVVSYRRRLQNERVIERVEERLEIQIQKSR